MCQSVHWVNLHFDRSKNDEGGRQSLCFTNTVTKTVTRMNVVSHFHRTFLFLHIVLANDGDEDDSSIFSSHAGSQRTSEFLKLLRPISYLAKYLSGACIQLVVSTLGCMGTKYLHDSSSYHSELRVGFISNLDWAKHQCVDFKDNAALPRTIRINNSHKCHAFLSPRFLPLASTLTDTSISHMHNAPPFMTLLIIFLHTDEFPWKKTHDVLV